MEFAYLLTGGAPIVKKFQVGAAMATAGVPVLVGGSGEEGLVLASTTGAADMVGVTIDTAAAPTTSQNSDGSDTATEIAVIVNPLAVYRARLAGSATAGAALTAGVAASANTAGTTIDADTDYSSPSMDEGTIFGYSGANAGRARKITSLSSTAAVVTVPFPADIAAGDEFLVVPFTPGENQFVQLTSNLAEVNTAVTIDTDNNNFRVIELGLKAASDNGTANSVAYLVPFDMIWSAGGSV